MADKIIKNIVSANSNAVKIDNLKKIFQHHLQDNNTENLERVLNKLPDTAEILEIILHDNENHLSPLDGTIVPQTLEHLQENLQLSLSLLHLMEEFLSLMTKKGALDGVEFSQFIITINDLVNLTLQHCKARNNIYGIYLTNLCEEFTSLFMVARKVHSQLLSIIEKQLVFESSDEINQCLLTQILDMLCDSAEIFSKLNTQSMLSSWRCYLNILKKYANQMVTFQPMRPLTVLYNEVYCRLHQYIYDDHVLKICNYLLRVGKAVLTSSWRHCTPIYNRTHLLGLFTDLYSFAGYSNLATKNGQLLIKHIFSEVHDVACRLLTEAPASQTELENCKLHCDGFVNITKLVLWDAKLFKENLATCNYLRFFFGYLNTIFPSPDAQEAYEYFTNDTNYQHILINMTATILAVSEQEYNDIEELLVDRMLNGEEWQKRFSYDLWQSIMKNAPPTLCFDTLTSISENYKRNSSCDFESDKYELLRALLSHCYSALSDNLQTKFLEKYSPEKFINVWAICGISNLPRGRDDLTGAIAKNVAKLMNSDMLKTQQSAFKNMMDGFVVLSNLLKGKSPQNQPKQVNELTAHVTKLWFINEKVMTSRLFVQFMSNALCPLVQVFIENKQMSNAQLQQILSQLSTNISLPDVKLITMKILLTIAQTPSDDYNVTIFSSIVTLLKAIDFENSDELNTVACAFDSNDKWKQNLKIVQNSGRDDSIKERKFVFSAKTRRTTQMPVDNNKPDEIMKNLETFEDTGTDEATRKKIKLQKYFATPLTRTTTVAERSGEGKAQAAVDDIIDQMKDEVKQLKKLARSGKLSNFSKDNSRDIFNIVKELQQLM